jgi:hypothetical protein
MRIMVATLVLIGLICTASHACAPGQQKVCEYNPALHRYMCWCA